MTLATVSRFFLQVEEVRLRSSEPVPLPSSGRQFVSFSFRHHLGCLKFCSLMVKVSVCYSSLQAFDTVVRIIATVY